MVMHLLQGNRLKIIVGLTGTVGGLLSPLLGIGGGTLMVPAMMLIGLPTRMAIGSSLVAIVPISLIGLGVHVGLARDRLDLITVGFLLVGSLIGARIGSLLSNKSPVWILKKGLALLILVMGFRLSGFLGSISIEAVQPPGHQFILLVGLGLVVGFLSSLLGIGGGVVIVPALLLIFAFPIHSAVVTSLGLIVPTSLVGAWFHYRLGHVDGKMALNLALPALIGAICGALLANSLEPSTLRFVFGLALLIISGRLVLDKKVLN